MGDDNGKKSYIQSNGSILERKSHTYTDFLALVKNFYVSIDDGQIVVKNLDYDKIFLQCKHKCENVVKDELDYLTVNGIKDLIDDANDRYLRIGLYKNKQNKFLCNLLFLVKKPNFCGDYAVSDDHSVFRSRKFTENFITKKEASTVLRRSKFFLFCM